MRGIPWLRLCLVAAFLALLAIPVWRITAPSDKNPPPPAPPLATATAPSSPATLRIEATAPWTSLSLTLLGKNIPLSTAPDGASATAALDLPDSGADLVISASWPDDAASRALRLRARNEHTHRDILDHTLWGRDLILDAVTLPPTP